MLFANFSTNGKIYVPEGVEELESTRKEMVRDFMDLCINTMFLVYQLLILVILVSIFGLLLVVMVKKLIHIAVLVVALLEVIFHSFVGSSYYIF